MSTCAMQLAWLGPCSKPAAPNSNYCPDHVHPCVVCGQPANHQCDATEQFVCGAYLCLNCTGYYWPPNGDWPVHIHHIKGTDPSELIEQQNEKRRLFRQMIDNLDSTSEVDRVAAWEQFKNMTGKYPNSDGFNKFPADPRDTNYPWGQSKKPREPQTTT